MIKVGTILNIIDNSGAKKVRCIKVYKVGRRDFGIVGNSIIISVLVSKKKKIIKGALYKAVIVRTRFGVIRYGGESVKFQDNSAVILKANKLPIGTRVLGPVMFELRFKGYMKIVSLAYGVM